MTRPGASTAPTSPLRGRVAVAPANGYATVTSYGGSTRFPAKVSASAGSIAVGDAVRLEMQGRRPVIVGKA